MIFSLPLLTPSSDEARDWLSEELGGWRYQIHREFLRDLWEKVTDLFIKLFGVASGSIIPSGLRMTIAILIVAVILSLIIFIIVRQRNNHKIKISAEKAEVNASLTSAQYRDLAAKAFAIGDYDEAIISHFRGMLSDLDERTILLNRPGITAQEVVWQIGKLFPQYRDEIIPTAGWFNLAAYGLGEKPRTSRELAQMMANLTDLIAHNSPKKTLKIASYQVDSNLLLAEVPKQLQIEHQQNSSADTAESSGKNIDNFSAGPAEQPQRGEQ